MKNLITNSRLVNISTKQLTKIFVRSNISKLFLPRFDNINHKSFNVSRTEYHNWWFALNLYIKDNNFIVNAQNSLASLLKDSHIIQNLENPEQKDAKSVIEVIDLANDNTAKNNAIINSVKKDEPKESLLNLDNDKATNNASGGNNSGGGGGKNDGSDSESTSKKAQADRMLNALKYIGGIGGTIVTAIIKSQIDKYFSNKDQERIDKLKSSLLELVEICSADYILQAARIRNFEEIQNIERIVNTVILDFVKELSINDEIDEQYTSIILNFAKELSINNEIEQHSLDNGINEQYTSKDLTNLLYIINSLANYYLNKHHNFTKARELIEKGSKIIVNYLENEKHAYIPKNKKFENLSNENKLKVLQEAATGLAEVYTISMYLMGRTYIYESKDKHLGSRYFKLSYYLGNKLKLFESILAIRGGLNIIVEQEIDEALQSSATCAIAKEKIKQVINSLNLISGSKDETKTYIVSYKLRKIESEQEKKKLFEDNYHQIECAEQLIKYYIKLIAISADKQEKVESLKNITVILFGISDEQNNYLVKSLKIISNKLYGTAEQYSNNHVGLIKRINDDSSFIPNQKKAAVYNTLGNMINILETIGIKTSETTEIYKGLIEGLKLDDLDIAQSQTFVAGLLACKIFAKAYLTTVNSNFTKIDAYNAYFVMLEQHPKLLEYINELEQLEKPDNAESRTFNDPTNWQCLRQFEPNENQVHCIGISDDNN